MAYRIAPYSKEEPTQEQPQDRSIEERLSKLETILNGLTAEGGKFNGLL
jgi:hypothetical protein